MVIFHNSAEIDPQVAITEATTEVIVEAGMNKCQSTKSIASKQSI